MTKRQSRSLRRQATYEFLHTTLKGLAYMAIAGALGVLLGIAITQFFEGVKHMQIQSKEVRNGQK